MLQLPLILTLTLPCLILTTAQTSSAIVPTPNITIQQLDPLVQCKPVLITWSGGRPPFEVLVYPENRQDDRDWLLDLGLTTRRQWIWTVNLVAGTGVVINVYDGVNDEYTPTSWIETSNSPECLIGFRPSTTSSSTSASASSVSSSVFTTSSGQASSAPVNYTSTISISLTQSPIPASTPSTGTASSTLVASTTIPTAPAISSSSSARKRVSLLGWWV